MRGMKWLVLAFLAASAGTDLLWRKIPNLFFVLALGAGILRSLLISGESAIPVDMIGRLFFILTLFYPIWKMRLMGAGDGKLFAVTGALLGGSPLISCLFYSLWFGGILSMIHFFRYRNFYSRMKYLIHRIREPMEHGYMKKEEMTKENTIPYALAFFMGYLLWFYKGGLW